MININKDNEVSYDFTDRQLIIATGPQDANKHELTHDLQLMHSFYKELAVISGQMSSAAQDLSGFLKVLHSKNDKEFNDLLIKLIKNLDVYLDDYNKLIRSQLQKSKY